MNGLTELPGIGEKIATKLVSHFGSEENALKVIYNRDAASLSEVPGISEKYAISIIQETLAHEEGVSIDDFLATQESMNVYERIMGLVRSYSHTSYSRARLSTYFPYPSHKIEQIKTTQAEIERYVALAKQISKSKDNDPGVWLKKVRQLKKPQGATKSRDRVMITDNKRDYDTVVKENVDKFMDVYIVDTMQELVDIARGYSQALVAGNKFVAADFPEDVSIDFLDNVKDIHWLVPEMTIGFFATNKEPIEAALDVVSALRSGTGFKLCEYADDAKVGELMSELSRITPEGDLVLGLDSELDRYKDVLKRFQEVLQSTLKKANVELSERMDQSTVTFKGSQLLGMFGEKGADSGLKNLLEKEVAKAYVEVVAAAKDRMKNELSLKPFEMQFVDLMFKDEIVYPVEVNYRAIDNFKAAINQQMVKRSLELKRTSAKKLSRYEEMCVSLIKDVLEFDMYYAIGLFAADYDLKMPKLMKKPGIGIVNGRNIFLGNATAKKIEPVSYGVGVKAPGTKGERVVLLSGVNSGGKTTLLDMVAQIVILTQMGFPVPCESAEIGLADKLLYFSKSKGTLTAGAFETTIKDFSRVITKESKIVLVDELESITEPGASARIIAGILETLSDNEGAVAVFVSHLAEQILSNTKCTIRVDGIEAKGLDANLNLIVDRTPRYNYLAKSTPELIVERLTRLSDGDKKVFYDKLLSKFRDN